MQPEDGIHYSEGEITVEDLKKRIKYLRAHAIKPYKGYYGIGAAGMFPIKNEAEFQQLIKNEKEILRMPT